ncbi:MAG: TraB/GumN family protein [Caulobacterales bacterium]|mgnify:CR=1 FL=1|nr:TraB/GumN family protein [Caulobacterales bacterium]
MRRIRAAVLAAIAALGALCAPALAIAAPAMWRVRDADSEIYLFGTMHVLPAGLKWRTPLFDQAYARADQVWFETDMRASPETLAALMAKYGVDTDRPLTQKLTSKGLDDLKPLLDRRKVALERLDHLRPWAAAMMLSVAPMVQKGASVRTGADATVTRAAAAEAKPIRTFETLEEQMRMFAQLPESVEVQYLEDVIAEQVRPPKNGVALQKAWMNGAIDKLAPLLVKPMRRNRPALYDALLKRRNEAWAEALGERMQGSGVDLVNVGALHMVGDDGLPALMAARGYEVTRVQ